MKWLATMDKYGAVDTTDLDFIRVVEIISCSTSGNNFHSQTEELWHEQAVW